MKLATLCYVFNENKVLMLNRNKRLDDMHKGKWNGLGGKFNNGETPEECVIREIAEESGLKITNPKLKGFITFPSFDEWDDWYVFVFTANEFTGELIESNEGELEWIDWNKVPQLHLWDGDKYFLEWLHQDKFFSAKFIYKNSEYKSHTVTFY
ncbi:MAG: 8-oxo-dGTP diphosphatase [Bacteroidetes bacterium]|nr:8-oxo-dGTP diphosphatase [Bacteroidota bacterium]